MKVTVFEVFLSKWFFFCKKINFISFNYPFKSKFLRFFYTVKKFDKDPARQKIYNDCMQSFKLNKDIDPVALESLSNTPICKLLVGSAEILLARAKSMRNNGK